MQEATVETEETGVEVVAVAADMEGKPFDFLYL